MSVYRPCRYFHLRISDSGRVQLQQLYRLARLETPGLTWDALLRRLAIASGVQVRRRLRARGIDYSHLIAPPAPAPDPFTGPPDTAPRSYEHARKKGKPFKGPPKKAEPRAYD